MHELSYEPVLDFWFKELSPDMWWKKDAAVDALIEERFGQLHRCATQCELYPWRRSAKGALAEIIILDQFSRNIYRDQAEAFRHDALALALAQSAVEKGLDKNLEPIERSFLYMPFMHSESSVIHKQAVDLFTQLDNKQNLDFELQHKRIIDRFGRYPHRNNVLGRVSTEQEKDFLKTHSGF